MNCAGSLLLIGSIAVAQSNSGNPLLLDAALPSVYLRFDGFERRTPVHAGESGDRIRLTLHNNSKGAISLCTESLYVGSKVRPLKLRSGKTVLALRDGTKAEPCYSLELDSGNPAFDRKQAATMGPVGDYRVIPGAGGDISSTSWIASGGWIVVSVPKENLAARSRIRIPFNYEWESNAQNEAHLILFQSSEIPK